MAKYKEAAVVVLDVGPHMANPLPCLRKAIFLLAEGKLLNNAQHEVAVVLFGTTETENEVYKEFIKEGGDASAYKHISVIQPLMCPDLGCLGKINNITCGRGSSDHVSALLVGIDLIKKAIEARKLSGKRRILLFSTYDSEVEELDAEYRDTIINELSKIGVSLEGYGVGDGAPARSPEAASNRERNLQGLHDLLAQVSGSYKALPTELQMSALFTLKHTAGTAAKHTLRIGSTCKIEVEVYKKTAKENVPSLKMYNVPAAAGGSGIVKRETEYRAPSNLDRAVAPEEKTKAYRYGHQLVPVHDDFVLKYTTGKLLELVGFTDANNVPRWHYTGECQVMVGQTPVTARALSALVQALHRQKKVAVLRMAATAKSEVMLLAGTPCPARSAAQDQQDCLLLNKLPFSDDFRQLAFRSFQDEHPTKQHLRPTLEQKAIMHQLVHSLQLAPNISAAARLTAGGVQGQEQLKPEDTLNPMMQRFYWFIGQRALDPQYQVPDASEDLLAAAVLDQKPADQLPLTAQRALEALPSNFDISAQEQQLTTTAFGAAAPAAASAASADAGPAPVLAADEGGVRLVSAVGTAHPVEDFNTLLESGLLDQAFSGMQGAIISLVDASLGARNYSKAAEAVQALRAAAVKHKQPAQFTSFLDKLRDSYKPNPGKRDFWKLLMQQGMAPISDDEVEGAGISNEAAAEYVRKHSADEEAAPEAPKAEAAPKEEEEDEFAGME
eukprot:GHRR01000753.1.p1 GENE.GHRR01000753.1~~GHRR01000753.1.p1  ORF type:complete len:726 (+),score=264.12 GHRR01000753.1:354-2531(+)